MDPVSWLPANWDAPPWIKAGTSTRRGGTSRPPFDSQNLAMHVGDEPRAVMKNRAGLAGMLGLPSEPVWLKQQHGKRIISATDDNNRKADGSFTGQSGIVCAVLTADCVPLLLCNRSGTRIAAIHIGWRGFCQGIVNQAVQLFADTPDNILAWTGPHISRAHYEVGNDVRDACLQADQGLAGAFVKNSTGRWQAGLEQMIRQTLESRGITQIYSAGQCTCARAETFFSYRRDGRTGRMASLIWIDGTARVPLPSP